MRPDRRALPYRPLDPGVCYRLRLPSSDSCVQLRLAGRLCLVVLRADACCGERVQLYGLDGRPCAPELYPSLLELKQDQAGRWHGRGAVRLARLLA